MGISVVKDEADKKIEEAREKYRQGDLSADRTMIRNGDPGKRYRFINRRESQGHYRVADYEDKGYEIVPEGDKAKAVFGRPKEGGQVVGDLVLMSTSMDNYKRRSKAAVQRQYDREAASKEQTRERLNRIARETKVVGPYQDVMTDESGDK